MNGKLALLRSHDGNINVMGTSYNSRRIGKQFLKSCANEFLHHWIGISCIFAGDRLRYGSYHSFSYRMKSQGIRGWRPSVFSFVRLTEFLAKELDRSLTDQKNVSALFDVVGDLIPEIRFNIVPLANDNERILTEPLGEFCADQNVNRILIFEQAADDSTLPPIGAKKECPPFDSTVYTPHQSNRVPRFEEQVLL